MKKIFSRIGISVLFLISVLFFTSCVSTEFEETVEKLSEMLQESFEDENLDFEEKIKQFVEKLETDSSFLEAMPAESENFAKNTPEKTASEKEEKFEVTINNAVSSFEKAFDEMSPEMEYHLGRAVAASILNQYEVLDAPELTRYLNKICSAITLNTKKPLLYKGYSVVILDSDELNAMATPGGHIFVTKGLLKYTKSEDEIAAVLAHEIAHIQLRHSISVIKASRFTDAAITSLMAIVEISMSEIDEEINFENFEFINQASEKVLGTLVTSGFSVSQEYMADLKAIDFMKKAGYSPEAMKSMLTEIKKSKRIKEKESGWGKTHPEPEKRISVVKVKLQNSVYPVTPRRARQKRFKKYMSEINA